MLNCKCCDQRLQYEHFCKGINSKNTKDYKNNDGSWLVKRLSEDIEWRKLCDQFGKTNITFGQMVKSYNRT
jgi:hypothetical protein